MTLHRALLSIVALIVGLIGLVGITGPMTASGGDTPLIAALLIALGAGFVAVTFRLIWWKKAQSAGEMNARVYRMLGYAMLAAGAANLFDGNATPLAVVFLATGGAMTLSARRAAARG